MSVVGSSVVDLLVDRTYWIVLERLSVGNCISVWFVDGIVFGR